MSDSSHFYISIKSPKNQSHELPKQKNVELCQRVKILALCDFENNFNDK